MNPINNLSRYTTKTTKIDNGKGYWAYLNVEIFENEVKIGEYVRNYSTFYNTFYPFKQGDKEYALYSKDYTSTRIMSLPDCKDLGGEESCAFGFCPTGFYVPYMDQEEDDGIPPDWTEKDIYECNPVGPNGQFGFVCGCVWGDDSGGWKIQFLDLSRASEGIIKRGARFGYLEMSPSLSSAELKDAIHIEEYSQEEWDKNVTSIAITGTKYFTLSGDRRGSSITDFHCPKCNRENTLRSVTINENYKQTLFLGEVNKVVCPYCAHEEVIK